MTVNKFSSSDHAAPEFPLSGTALYNQIVSDADAADDAMIKYQIAPAQVTALKMAGHFHPLSITPGEFDYLRDFIVRHQLRCGYECATAFGVSALAAAFGFQKTGGKLVTIDAYIEEQHNLSTAYRHLKAVNQGDPDGLKSLRWLLARFNLESYVTPVVGWSPDHVAQAVTDGHGADAAIDYAFIDAGHWDEAVLADAMALRPFVDTSRPYALFFHDIPCFSPSVWSRLQEAYGVSMQPISTIGESWGMGVMTNIVMA